MGGNSSSENSGPKLGEAHIQLDQQSYHAGAAVTGTVYFIVH
jgi:hypothetical protein